MMQSKIADTIRKWRHPPEDRLPRDLGELLRTVHSVVSFIPADAITKNHELNVNSHPAEVSE